MSEILDFTPAAKTIKKRTDNFTDKQIELLDQMTPEIKQYAYAVGNWLWLEFPEKPDQKVLDLVKTLGFRWNRDRKLWQHNCGCFVCRNNPDIDPRAKYGVVSILENDLKKTK